MRVQEEEKLELVKLSAARSGQAGLCYHLGEASGNSNLSGVSEAGSKLSRHLRGRTPFTSPTVFFNPALVSVHQKLLELEHVDPAHTRPTWTGQRRETQAWLVVYHRHAA